MFIRPESTKMATLLKEPFQPQKTDQPIINKTMAVSNWHTRVEWFNLSFAVFVPTGGMIQAIWTPLKTETAVLAVFLYICTGLSITAGTFSYCHVYDRL